MATVLIRVLLLLLVLLVLLAFCSSELNPTTNPIDFMDSPMVCSLFECVSIEIQFYLDLASNLT